MRISLYDKIKPAPTGYHQDEFAPYLDTFLLEGASTPLGAVLVLPGGGYTHRARHEGDPVAEAFRGMGFHAFTLQYRVAPYNYPAPQQDVMRAIRIIRAHAAEWKLNPEQIAVLGFSAGGHLAACSGVLYDEIPKSENDDIDAQPGRPDALILCYPVIAGSEPFAHRGSMMALHGENASEKAIRNMDTHRKVDENTPPAFLWHTADDPAVPVQNSISFAQAMWSCGNSCELHVFPHGSHGRGLAMDMPDASAWPVQAADFLETTANFTRGRIRR